MDINTHEFSDLDHVITQALQSGEQPSAELNQRLNAALLEKEVQMLDANETKQLPLWYLPMLLNSACVVSFVLMLRIFIQNSIILQIATGLCIYLVLAGIGLTLAGMKGSNFKAHLTIERKKKAVVTSCAP